MTELASFLEAHAEVALARWVDHIRIEIAGGGETDSELRDHIPAFIKELVASLRTGRVPEESRSAEEHGRQRYRIGFDVDALIREYGVLRNVLFDLFEEASLPLTLTEVRLLTNFITNAIAEGVVEHNAQRERAQGVVRDELLERAERARAEAEHERKRLAEIFAQAPVAICINEGPDHHYSFANAAYLGTIGRRDVLGKPIREALPEMKNQPFPGMLDEVFATGRPIVGNAQPAIIIRGGEPVECWYNFVFTPKRNTAGDIDGVMQFAFDVTSEVRALRRTEAAVAELARSEERRLRVVAASGAGVWDVDLASGDIEADARCKTLLGVPTELPLTLGTALAAVHEADRTAVADAVEAAAAGVNGGRYHMEFRTGGAGDVPLRWIESRGEVQLDAAGAAARLAGALIDITERKRLAEQQRASEEEWGSLADALPLLVSFVDANETYRLVNRAYAEWFGVPREDVIGRTVRDLIGEGAYAALSPKVKRGLAGERFSFEQYGVPYRLGGMRDVKVSFVPRHARSGAVDGYVALIEDITVARRLTVESERLSVQRTEVLEAMGDAFLALDAEFRVVFVNRRYEETAGKSREAIIGKTIWELSPEISRPSSPFYQSYHQSMRERAAVNVLDHQPALDTWTDVRVYPTGDGGISVVLRDVTVEKRAEALLKRQAEFEQQIIGIVSHDLRNPLNVITMAAHLLKSDESLSAPSAKFVLRMQNAVERANRMVIDLLDFTQARLGGGIVIERQRMDFRELVVKLVEEVEAAHPSRTITITQDGDGDGEWDPDRLGQVVQNLVTNAVKYSPDASTVIIHTQSSKESVTLLVHNDGPPIPADKLPIVFEPFQRAVGTIDKATKSVGLGLYIVKHIVEAHQGSIAVESTEANGTTFRVDLPRSVRFS